MPAVVVHDLAQAILAAKAAGNAGARLTLRSAPAAGRGLGVGGWLALAEAARTAVPTADVAFCLDCADDAGDAQAAIAAGAERIALSSDAPAHARIRALADAAGATLDQEPPALDLAFTRDPEAAVGRLLMSKP